MNFKKKIEIESKNTEDKDTINLLYSILEQIEKIKSYGLKGKKRLYVNYNKERKVKKKKIKEEKLIILMEIIFPKKQ